MQKWMIVRINHTLGKNTDVLMIILLTGGFMIPILFILPYWPSLFAGETVYGVIGAINLTFISVIFHSSQFALKAFGQPAASIRIEESAATAIVLAFAAALVFIMGRKKLTRTDKPWMGVLPGMRR